jgi:hypothetical protein
MSPEIVAAVVGAAATVVAALLTDLAKKAVLTTARRLRIYHATGETLDVIATPGLERVARVLAFACRPWTRRNAGRSSRKAIAIV